MVRQLAARGLALIVALGLGLSLPNAARAEAATLRVAKQYGLGYLQFMVMQDQGLI